MPSSENRRSGCRSNAIFGSFVLLLLPAFVEAQPVAKLQALQDVWLFTRIQAVAPNGGATDVTKAVVEKLAEVSGPQVELGPGFTFRPLKDLDAAIVRPDGTKRDSVDVVAGILATTLDAARLDVPTDGMRMSLVVIAGAEKGAKHVTPGDSVFLRLFNMGPLKDADSALVDYVFGQSLPGAGEPGTDDPLSILRHRMLAGRFQLGSPPKGVNGDLAVLANMPMKRIRGSKLPPPAPTIWRKTTSPPTRAEAPASANSFIDARFTRQDDEGGGLVPSKASDLVAAAFGTAIICAAAGIFTAAGTKSPYMGAGGGLVCVAITILGNSGPSPLETLWERNVPPEEACIVRQTNPQSVAVFVKAAYEPPLGFVSRSDYQTRNGLAAFQSNSGCGRSSGDPHLSTHDGLKYDFQGVGEFVLSKAEEFEVQARMVPWGGSKTVSINGAVAAKFGNDRVALYPGDPIRFTINGVETETLNPGEAIYMPGGLQIEKYKEWYRFARNGYLVEANPGKTRVGTIFVRVPEKSEVAGLLGSRDGNRENDLALPDGEFLKAPVQFDDLYRRFGNAWRVETRNSLFDYKVGESAGTFNDVHFPSRRTSVADVGADARRAAEEVCRKAGLTGASDLEDCVYDIAVTGDETFADDAKGGREDVERLETRANPQVVRESANGVKIEVPSEAIASFPVEIRVSGPVEAHTLTFAAVGNPPSSRPPNAYSSIRLSGGEQVVKLHAPYRPGKYELRYVTFPGHRTVLLSIPFTSTPPHVTILADDSAYAGGNLKVSLVGDMSPNTKVTVVPIGSREDHVGPHAFVKGGLRETVTIFRLPRSPGKYEIRFVSATSETVYARKAIELK